MSCSRTQGSDAGEARTRGPSVSSHTHTTLSHCAPYYVGYVCHVGYGCLLVFSNYNLCKHGFEPRSGQTKCRARSGSKLVDILMLETFIRPHILLSDLGLHCLPMPRKQDTCTRLMFINCSLPIILANRLEPDQA